MGRKNNRADTALIERRAERREVKANRERNQWGELQDYTICGRRVWIVSPADK